MTLSHRCSLSVARWKVPFNITLSLMVFEVQWTTKVCRLTATDMNVEIQHSALSNIQLYVRAKEMSPSEQERNLLQVNLYNSTIGQLIGSYIRLSITNSHFDQKDQTLQPAFALVNSVIRLSECTIEMGYSTFALTTVYSQAEIHNTTFSFITAESPVIKLVQPTMLISQTDFSNIFGIIIYIKENSTLTVQDSTIMESIGLFYCIVCTTMFSTLYVTQLNITQTKSPYGSTMGVSLDSHVSITATTFQTTLCMAVQLEFKAIQVLQFNHLYLLRTGEILGVH